MLVPVPATRRLRIERRFERRELRAEAAQHVLQHVIAADAQLAADDLHLGVAVAEMPGEPHQLLRVRRRDLDQRLRLAGDPHDRAVVEHQPVAVAQLHRLRQIEQIGRAALADEHDAPAMAVCRHRARRGRARRSRPIAPAGLMAVTRFICARRSPA